jgi:hypothetical protein
VLEAQAEVGMSIRDIAGENASDQVLAFINGEPIAYDQWEVTFPGTDDVVNLISMPAGSGKDLLRTLAIVAVAWFAWTYAPALAGWAQGAGATGFFASEAFWMGATFAAGSMLVNTLIPPAIPNMSGPQEQKRAYAITGSRNNVAPYNPVPNCYGTHKLYPPFAALPYTEIIGNDQYFNALYCLGLGQYSAAAADVKVGETALLDHDGVDVTITSDVPVFPTILEDQLNITLAQHQDPPLEGESATRTSADGALSLSVDFNLPAGLLFTTKKGDRYICFIYFRVEYRKVGTSTWLNVRDTDWESTTGTSNTVIGTNVIAPFYTFNGLGAPSTPADVFHVAGASIDAKRVGLKWDVAEAAQYEVRITRVKTFNSNSGSSNAVYEDDDVWRQYQAIFVWTALRAYKDSNAVNVSNGEMTFLKMRLRASDKLSGIVDTLNLITTRKLPIWNGSVWSAPTATTNPAWAWCDVLKGSANARPVTDAQLDLAGILSWANDCTTAGYAYNEVIDYQTSVFDAVRRVASVGRAAVSNRDGKWTVIQESTTQLPVQYFTPRNSYGFSSSKQFIEVPHALKVRFISEDADYQEDEIIVYDDGYSVANASRFEVLEFKGITDPDIAWKFGRYHLAALRLRPEVYTFSADVEQIVCQRGDHIRIAHDVPMWGTGQARIKSVTSNTIVLDEKIACSTTIYRMRIRKSDGTGVLINVSTTIAEEQDTFTRTSTVEGTYTGVAAGDLVMLGAVGAESVSLLVLGVQPNADLGAEIIAVDSAPAILTADTGTIPTYDPGITMPADPRLFVPPKPYNVRAFSGDNLLTILPDGSSVPRMLVAWDYPSNADAIYPGATVTLRYRRGLYDGVSIIYVGELITVSGIPASAGGYTITDIEVGSYYEIVLTAYSRTGVSSGDTAPIYHTVLGITEPVVNCVVPALTAGYGYVAVRCEFTQAWEDLTGGIANAGAIEFGWSTTNDTATITDTVRVQCPTDLTGHTVYDTIIFDDTTTRYFWARIINVNGSGGAWSASTSGAALASVAQFLRLATTGQIFSYSSDGSLIGPGVIEFNVQSNLLSGDVTWTVWDALGNPITPLTIGSSPYLTASITGVNFTAITNNAFIKVRATREGFYDEIMITKVSSGSGTDGVDGEDALYAWLTNEVHVVATAADGTGADVTSAVGFFEIYKGLTDVSEGTAFTVDGGVNSGDWHQVTQNGLRLRINRLTTGIKGKYELYIDSAWTSTQETFTLNGSYNGVTVTKKFVIAKSLAGTSGIDGEDAIVWYIKPTDGTAIKNSSGTLTVEAHKIEGGVDNHLSAGSVQLYVGSSLVTVANGYATGSDGYTGVFDAGDISDSVVVELKDGSTGDPLDTITLVDITDGTDGSDAVIAWIEPSAPITWVRAVDQTTWAPTGTSVDLDAYFYKGSTLLARIARRVTRDANGILSISTTTHKDGDYNIGNVGVTLSGTSSRSASVKFTHTVELVSVSETVSAALSGASGDDGNNANLYYIKPTDGTAIKNSTGTLTIEARHVDGTSDSLLSSGTIQLYVGTTLVTAANGFVTGSNGYTGIFDAGDISDSVVVELKDGPTGTVYDTITLVDITDGEPGDHAIVLWIEPSAPLAWTRAIDQSTWDPTSTTVDLDCYVYQGAIVLARIARRVTRDASGILTVSTVAHKDGDYNTGAVTVSTSGTGRVATVNFEHTSSGVAASETVITSLSGSDGTDGDDGVSPTLYFIKPTTGTAIKNSTGTLTVEAWKVENGVASKLNSGTIQLYNPSNTALGFDETFNAASINSSIVITLKDGTGGTPLDTITLVDITDGEPGEDGTDGSDAVVGWIEPSGPLAWVRAVDQTTGDPTSTTVDLDCYFYQGTTLLARIARRITRAADGTLSVSTTTHKDGDSNTGAVTVSTSGTGKVVTVRFEHTASGISVSETVLASLSGATGADGDDGISPTLYYIKATNGTAIKNSTGTLTVEAWRVANGVAAKLTSGTIQLYNPSNTALGYDETFTAAGINGSIVITLKDGTAGAPLDTITLADITDGDDGGTGPAGVVGWIEPSAPLAWVRAVDQVTWDPTGTSVDLDTYFYQGGTLLARVARRVTRDAAGNLSVSTTTHKDGDYETASVTVSTTGTGKTRTVIFTHTASGVKVAETVLCSLSGDDGADGDDGISPTLYYIKPTTGTAIKNSSGTLTVEAWKVENGAASKLTSGTIQLYNPSNTALGYEETLSAAQINSSIVITLKDGTGGTPLDTITLVDVTDGLDGDEGADGRNATVGYVEADYGGAVGTLAWVKAPDGGSWTPSDTYTDLNATFVRAGTEVARIARRLTLNTGTGALTVTTVTHKSGTDLNTSHVTVTVKGAGTQAVSILFDYDNGSGDLATVTEAVSTTIGGSAGSDGEDGTDASPLNLTPPITLTYPLATSMGGWYTIYGSTANAEARRDIIGPNGGYPLVVRTFSVSTTLTWVYGLAHQFAVNPNRGYITFAWVARKTANTRSVYFGYTAQTGYIMSLAGAQTNNPYFISDAWSEMTVGKWYLAVGVIHPMGTTTDSGIAGLYDPDTGAKVRAGSEWRHDNAAPTTQYIRLGYHTTGAGQTTADGISIMPVGTFLMDGNEPTTRDVLGVVSVEDFANGLMPIQVVTSQPTTSYLGSDVLLYTGDGKLYRWQGTWYSKQNDPSDIVTGTLSAGITATNYLMLGTNGKLYTAGKTSAYDIDAGIFMGYDGAGAHDFCVGNQTKYIRWDGSAGALSIGGDIIATGNIQAGGVTDLDEITSTANVSVSTSSYAYLNYTSLLVYGDFIILTLTLPVPASQGASCYLDIYGVAGWQGVGGGSIALAHHFVGLQASATTATVTWAIPTSAYAQTSGWKFTIYVKATGYAVTIVGDRILTGIGFKR